MIYTKNKESIIFQIPLSNFLGSTRKYKYIDKPIIDFSNSKEYNGRAYSEKNGCWYSLDEAKEADIIGKTYKAKGDQYTYHFESLQDFEQDIQDNFYGQEWYIEPDADQIDEASAYLIKQGYTANEINLFSDDLKQDVKRALNEAFEGNYFNEWFNQYRSMLASEIDEQFDEIEGAKAIDDVSSKEFEWDQEFFNVSIPIETIKDYYKDDDDARKWTENELIDEYIFDVVSQVSGKVDIEYVDHYGSLGSTDGWLKNSFSDFNEVSTMIDNYRIDEANKINNFERLSIEANENLKKVDEYIEKYINKKEKKEKIKRQIKALENVIKNAV